MRLIAKVIMYVVVFTTPIGMICMSASYPATESAKYERIYSELYDEIQFSKDLVSAAEVEFKGDSIVDSYRATAELAISIVEDQIAAVYAVQNGQATDSDLSVFNSIKERINE